MPGVAGTAVRPAARLETCWTQQVADNPVALAWHPGGEILAVGDAGGGLTLLSREDGRACGHAVAHRHGLSSVAMDPRGEYVVTGGQDGQVAVLNGANAAPVRTLEAGAQWVERVAWSRDGAMMACAAGRTVRVWDRNGVLMREFAGHRATVTDIQWHPREPLLCSTSYGGVSLLDPREEKPVKLLAWQGSSLSARWSPTGKYIATGEQDSTVHFWIVRSGEDLQMSGYPSKVRDLAWGGRGRLLATGGGHAVTVWDCSGRGPAGTKPMTLPGHEQTVSALEFDVAGDRLASGGEDGRVVIWAPAKARKLQGAVQLSEAVSSLAWLPRDGGELAVGLGNGEVRLLR